MLKTETLTEINPPDILIADNFFRFALHQYPALMDDIGPVDQGASPFE